MNLTVRNIPESSTEVEVREFLKKELGHYAVDVAVYEAGTPNAYAVVELDANVPYVGEVIARQMHVLHLKGVTLEASAPLFGGGPPRHA